MSCYDEACWARDLYRAGRITRAEAQRRCAEYAREFNKKSAELARKYGVRPRKFSFSAFCR